MADVVVKPLPFEEAMRAFERRAPHLVPTDRWTAMWQEEHATAFTVARSVGYDILGDIADELKKALAAGTTFEQFATNLKPMLQAKGWWGPSQEDDGSVVQLGSMSRLKTIYDTNLRVSYSAGAWERAQRTKSALPFMVYEGIRDGRQRPAHRAWTGTVKPVDDPWWNEHWPPCGWNCRCWVRQVNGPAAHAMPSFGKAPLSGAARSFTNSTTGEKVQVPFGIDPGWGYNPGKAALAGDQVADAAKITADKMAGAPPRVAAANPMSGAEVAALAREFGAWLDGVEAQKPKGDRRVVGAFDDRVLDHLEKQGVMPQTGGITINDHAIGHMLRDAKKAVAKAPALATLRDLPLHLAHPDAVLWDKDKGSLVYVIDVAGAKGTRLVVLLDRAVKVRDPATGKRATITTNAIVSGSLVPAAALSDKRRYELIEGTL